MAFNILQTSVKQKGHIHHHYNAIHPSGLSEPDSLSKCSFTQIPLSFRAISKMTTDFFQGYLFEGPLLCAQSVHWFMTRTVAVSMRGCSNSRPSHEILCFFQVLSVRGKQHSHFLATSTGGKPYYLIFSFSLGDLAQGHSRHLIAIHRL